MLKGIYDRMITNIAGQQTVTRPDMPLTELGVGDAEILNPIAHPYIMPRAMPSQYMGFEVPSARTIDDTKNIGRGPQVSPDDFIYTGYTGEAL